MSSSVRQLHNIRQHREMFAEEQRQAEERRLAPLKTAEKEYLENAQRVAEAERALAVIDVFNQPSDELAKRCTPYEVPATPLSVEQLKVLIQDAFHNVQLKLAQRGIELTESGVGKLDRVIRLNGEKCDATSHETWETAYEWIEEIGALTRTDRIITVHESTPEPTPEPTNLDELPSTDPRFRKAVEDAAVSDYFGPLLSGWLDHLREDWGFTPNRSQLQAVQRFFERHNLSPVRFDNFNKCRRALSDAGVFPQGMMTDRERLDEESENIRTLDSPSAKAAYLRRLRALD